MGPFATSILQRYDLDAHLKILQLRHHIDGFLWPVHSLPLPFTTYTNRDLRPWAMYGWTPLAILGEEINKLQSQSAEEMYSPVVQSEDEELTDVSSHSHHTTPVTITATAPERESLSTAGVYLGIWNIFATIPQFLATFIAAITFAILEPGKSPELAGDGDRNGSDQAGGDEKGGAANVRFSGLSGTAVCLAIGAVCSLVAGVRTLRLRRISK